ncbi:FISUMP domain-containing protein [candidate division KSB1 bacterium]
MISSDVGMMGGKQHIKMSDDATKGNIIHEIGHALGLFHEHSKKNRDDYVIIIEDNILEGKEHNFIKEDQSIITEGFDWGSIMLYPSDAFSENDEPTITKINGTTYTAQRDSLSDGDIEMINMMYSCPTSFIDIRDNKTYTAVRIGNQCWMAENLVTTKYSNGDPIPNIEDSTQWIYLTTGAYCKFENSITIATIYGYLYNWFAVKDSRNICPSGWHVPSNIEWDKLSSYLGGFNVAGGKLKESGNAHWSYPNIATNESGFTALPGGGRYGKGYCYFSDIYNEGDYWSSSERNYEDAWGRNMVHDVSNIEHMWYSKHAGISVRCLKD